MGERNENSLARDPNEMDGAADRSDRNEERVDLATTFLSLYDCMTDPDRYFEMTEILTSWLQEDHEPVEFRALDTHSELLWKQITEKANLREKEADRPCVVEFPAPSSVEQTGTVPAHILDHLCPEDITRLKTWLGTATEQALVVRYYQRNHPTRLASFERVSVDDIALHLSDTDFGAFARALFQTDFGISERELDVIDLLVQGQTLSEVARELGKSIETIRSQLKSVTGKLGARSQTDVVRLALQAQDIVPQVQPRTTTARTSGHARLLELPDGRKIEYEIDPPQDGHPVVFFHCVTFGRHWSEEAKQAARAAGLRVVRISRAGFGKSTVNEKTGAELLHAHVSDYAAVLSHEQIGSCSLFAQGLGIAAAYQFALAYPERVSGIVGLDVPPPVLKAGDASLLKGTFKTGALGNLFAPTSTKLVASFATRYLAKRNGPDANAPLALRGIDLSKHESVSGLAAYRANFEDARQSEGQCYWREASYSTVDWANAPTNANHRPVVHLLQSQDSVLVLPGATDELAKRIDAKLRGIDSFLPLIAGPMKEIAAEVKAICNRM